MRNAFMYILIGFIVALSLNNAVNRLCKRCFGILQYESAKAQQSGVRV